MPTANEQWGDDLRDIAVGLQVGRRVTALEYQRELEAS
jgi:hypothetical protein